MHVIILIEIAQSFLAIDTWQAAWTVELLLLLSSQLVGQQNGTGSGSKLGEGVREEETAQNAAVTEIRPLRVKLDLDLKWYAGHIDTLGREMDYDG